MIGVIWKSTGTWMRVQLESGMMVDARMKGKMKTLGIRSTHPLAVGDRVKMVQEKEDWLIEEIMPRENYIIRRANKAGSESQMMGSNLDQAVLIASVKSPMTSLGFIDRFLLCTEAYHIPALIVFNKMDILSTAEENEEVNYHQSIYEQAGYKVIKVSALHPKDIDILKLHLINKRSLFAGHSGAGKSTWLNLLVPGIEQKTGTVSESHQKGKHTTTFAEMFALPEGGEIIDSPGIREFGIIGMEPDEIWEYFPELRNRSGQCKYHNCKHINEPGCQVVEWVKNGEFALERYESYLSIVANHDMMQ